jgi:hypothetical protein
MIRVGRQVLLSQTDVSARPPGQLLTDAQACTIASWWQGPGLSMLPFAELASTGTVSAAELCECIVTLLRDRAVPSPSTDDVRDLLDLHTWAVSVASSSRPPSADSLDRALDAFAEKGLIRSWRLMPMVGVYRHRAVTTTSTTVELGTPRETYALVAGLASADDAMATAAICRWCGHAGHGARADGTGTKC